MGNIFRRLWSPSSEEAHQVPVLPDEILEDIFLRLDAAADVACAAAACRTHHRVVSNPRFLRRYQFLHPPPVLGFLDLESMGNGFHAAEPPHKSAAAASSLAQAADFSFSFVPMEPGAASSSIRRRWRRVCDARDGRVLLSRRSADRTATFVDLVICDPLYRRYVEIPPVPEDLWDRRYSTEMNSEPFLLPAREEEEESQFRVIYNWVCRFKIITFLYGSDTKKWCQTTFFNLLPSRNISNPMNLARHHVGSCFYWVRRNYSSNYMLVLDPAEMAFSITKLPVTDDDDMQGLAVVDAGGVDDRVGVIVLRYVGRLHLHSKALQDDGGSTDEQWQLDMRHTLPEGYKHCHIIGAVEGCLVLVDYSTRIIQYSIMDTKTFLVERFCKSKLAHAVVHHALPYARYPPSMSAPSI